MPAAARFLPTVLAASALAPGCRSPETYARQSDVIVEDLLGGSSENLNAERRARIEMPATAVVPVLEPGVDQPSSVPGEQPGVRVLLLQDALEIAVVSNREYIGQLESLYGQALSLWGVRHTFGPLLTSTLNYVFANGERQDASSATSFGLGVSQRLPWGGSVSASGSTAHSAVDDGQPDSFSSGLSISLTQPLLRGFGREPGMEPLVQAERNLLYSIRDFELFRENFSIDVARQYYSLVGQKRALQNQRLNLEDVVFQRRQAEATLALGDVSELEVLRSRRSELTSQNDLIEAEETLRRALDSFRIFLGLPPGVRIDVGDESPTFIDVTYDVESAIEVAKKNRLDVLNRREQLEDSQRALRLAENGVLPNLDLSVSYGLAGTSNPSFVHQRLDDGAFTAALSLDVPIDAFNEREAMRFAQIAYRQAVRSYDLFDQNLEVDLRSTFRRLVRVKQSLEIQTQLIKDQERNVKVAQLLFEQGENTNRDVVEAQQSLLDARNALISEQVSYEIARLGLIRDLGILFIDEHGMWIE